MNAFDCNQRATPRSTGPAVWITLLAPTPWTTVAPATFSLRSRFEREEAKRVRARQVIANCEVLAMPISSARCCRRPIGAPYDPPGSTLDIPATRQ
jgi:hypothetical protein